MNKISILILVGVATLGHAFPGGYKLIGGVYQFDRPVDYIDQAKSAGKFAWDTKFAEELRSVEEPRGAREAAQVPTFFTASQPQPQPQQQPQVQAQPHQPHFGTNFRYVPQTGSAQPQHFRQARQLETYNLPLYYSAFPQQQHQQ